MVIWENKFPWHHPTPSTQAASLCTEPKKSTAPQKVRREGLRGNCEPRCYTMDSRHRVGFSIHGHSFSHIIHCLVLLWCFRRDSCFKQEVEQSNKIPSLEVISYDSKNTKFQEIFTTKDILPATIMPQPLHREAQVTDSFWSLSYFISSTVLGPCVGSLWRVEPGLEFKSPSSKILLNSIVPQGKGLLLPNLNYQYVFPCHDSTFNSI